MKFNPEIKRVDSQEKPLNTLKNEHLKEGVKPIIGGVYDRHFLDRDTQYFLDDFKNNADFVNFSYREKDLKENKMLNSGDTTYVISLCNEKNKYSTAYLDCTGVVAVGLDKETGKNISFLSHQNPGSFLVDNEVNLNFKKDLVSNIEALTSKCIPGSIDIVIFGGNKEDLSENVPDENLRMGIDDITNFNKGPFDDYTKSIKLLSRIISQKAGFSPVVMSGPNDNFQTGNHSLSVYFDNENRRLYMLRPKQNVGVKNEPFIASDVENQMKEIYKKEKEFNENEK